MNTKHIFFLSLIILSLAMGLNWLKNRPKQIKVQQPPAKTRQAVNFSDLQIQEDDVDEEDENEEDDEEKPQKNKKNLNNDNDNEDEESEEEEEGNKKSSKNNKEVVASESLSIENPLKDDPLMQEYFKVTRNPFEVSPYTKLVEKLKLEAEMASRPKFFFKGEVKVPKLMSKGKFTGTIETDRGLAALIDGSLYVIGSEFNGCIIKEIKLNLIILEAEKDEWLLPKTGVNINIDNETGEYTLTDKYE